MQRQVFFGILIVLSPVTSITAHAQTPRKLSWTRRAVGGKAEVFESKNGRITIVETDENSASGSSLQVWNARTTRLQGKIGESAAHRTGLLDVLQLMALSDDGRRLMTRRLVSDKMGIYKSQLEMWDIRSRPKLNATLPEKPENMVLDAVPTSKGWKLLFDHSMETLNGSGKMISKVSLQGGTDNSTSAWGALSSDGSRAVLSAGPQVFDAKGRQIGVFPLRGGLNVGFEFSPDNRFLVVGHRQILHSPKRTRDEFELWSLNRALPLRLKANLAGFSPAWSPDGSAVLGADGRFRGAQTGKLATFQIKWPTAKSLRFDSTRIARDGKTCAIVDGVGNVWFGVSR